MRTEKWLGQLQSCDCNTAMLIGYFSFSKICSKHAKITCTKIVTAGTESLSRACVLACIKSVSK